MGDNMGFFNRFREIPHRDAEVEHLAEDLHHLLNSYRGYGSPIRDIGLLPPDPHTDAAGAAKHLLANILSNLLRYLPGLAGPTLRTLSRTPDLVLHVELKGRIKGSEQPVRFLLHYCQPYGGVKVEVALAD